MEQRDFKRKQALGANLSKEEASRIKDASRGGGRALRTARGVNVDDIDVEERSDLNSARHAQSTAEDTKGSRKKKKIGGPRKGQAGCK